MKTLQVNLAITLSDESVTALAEILAPAIRNSLKPLTNDDVSAGERLHASKNAIFSGAKLTDDQGLLLTSRETAKLLKVSEKTIYNRWTTGEMPPPIRIGAAIRWSLETLKSWVNAGCPRVDPSK